MTNYSDLVAIPPDGAMNGGLSSPHNDFMVELLGTPGKPTRDCSPVTRASLKNRMVYSVGVTPHLTVSGLKPAVASLKAIFAQVKSVDARLYDECRGAGMLCCRLQRGSDTLFSNHSWGTAIDLYYGAGVAPQGQAKTHLGLLKLYPYFHNAGWYWGAEFGNPDGMYFETSRELLLKWRAAGLI